MKHSDLAELLGLAALWGASFLFVRMGAAEFGPIALAAMRVAGAALLPVPLLAWRAIFKAASALFGALNAWLWLKDRLTLARIVGLAIGLAGVLWLEWDKPSFWPGGSG